MIIYASACGIIMPRLFPGITIIVPVGVSALDPNSASVPLYPVSGNYTQPIYLITDLICFVIIQVVVRARNGVLTVLWSIVFYCVANIIFALIDIATFATNTQFLMDFIRNAQYDFHLDEEINGLKRIAGSFTEASSFAQATLSTTTFSGTLWLCGWRPLTTGPIALLSFILLIMSTSSTGLVGAIPMIGLFYWTALNKAGILVPRRQSAAAVLVLPLFLIAVVLLIVSNKSLLNSLSDYLDILIFNKSVSQSGVERASWNSYAWQSVINTWGVGVGLGTTRASSFALALLSNCGVVGAFFYIIFLCSTLKNSYEFHGDIVENVRLAAQNAALVLLGANLVSGALVDQGLFFYILVALSSNPGAQRLGGRPIDVYAVAEEANTATAK
ncbi:hypothetical protein [Methylobacterium sp.]|uniref:hypothetical protein n=1 Tax=Methylobacterium sp. TaxID=409 RepID=UPI003B008237